MKNEIPMSLKVATTVYVAELGKHSVLVRIRLLTALIASEIARKDPIIRDLLATHVIVGLLIVIKRLNLVKNIAKKSIEELITCLSSPESFRKFLN